MNKEELVSKVVEECKEVSGWESPADLEKARQQAEKLYDIAEFARLPGFEIEMHHNLGVFVRQVNGPFSIHYHQNAGNWSCYLGELGVSYRTEDTPLRALCAVCAEFAIKMNALEKKASLINQILDQATSDGDPFEETK